MSEGPTVAYHIATPLAVPSRTEEQVLEIARIELPPEFYYKSVPLLTSHVYRLADMVNKSNYVLLPGDPARVPLIAAGWAEGREIAVEREHVTFTGTLRDGGPISACSTGAGGPSTASAVEELIAIGADTFVRVGTCGAIQRHNSGRPDIRRLLIHRRRSEQLD